MNLINELLIIIIMISLNAVFSAYEMALASISRTKLTYLVQTKKKGASEALFMKDRIEASLAVVQLGVTLVGSIAAAIGGAGITEALNPYFQRNLGLSKDLAEFLSLATLIVPLSSFTIIFAELIPKIFAIKNSEWVVLKLSRIMVYFSFVANPAVSSLEYIVKSAIKFIDKKKPINSPTSDPQSSLHELTAALSLARTSRLINAQQERIVMSAAQLSLRPIKDIMIPAAEIFMIPKSSTLTEALVLAHLDMHTRFPVCEKSDDPQTIQGYINFKDIIAALKINPEDPTIKGTIRPLIKFLDTTPISKVFERMIQEKLHICLIENTQGQVIGMVTQEDIIEELVGEIEDEFDRLPNYIHPYGNQWLVGGATPMSALAKTLGINWPLTCANEEDFKLADWCQRKFANPLKGGEIISRNGFQITVRKLRRNKISEAFVTKDTAAPQA
ncbi:MAG: HlyC/CorC family transporter [Candidatus Omnitrophica bacterium]|nr:HlyC/CorC family transporter [Candidatus Omnitrophota bacterium]